MPTFEELLAEMETAGKERRRTSRSTPRAPRPKPPRAAPAPRPPEQTLELPAPLPPIERPAPRRPGDYRQLRNVYELPVEVKFRVRVGGDGELSIFVKRLRSTLIRAAEYCAKRFGFEMEVVEVGRPVHVGDEYE